jgi:hypothetical protein
MAPPEVETLEAPAEAAEAAVLERERPEAAMEEARKAVSSAAATSTAATVRDHFRISAFSQRSFE